MKGYPWLTLPVVALLVLPFLVVASPSGVTLAQSGPSMEDRRLAQTYVPVLYFHPDELYCPQPAGVLVDTARLRQAGSHQKDAAPPAAG